MAKKTFVEGSTLSDSTVTGADILIPRIEDAGQCFKQVAKTRLVSGAEIESVLPDGDVEGVHGLFKLTKGFLGLLPEFIDSHALKTWLEDSAVVFQCGMCVIDTCHEHTSPDGRKKLGVPSSVMVALKTALSGKSVVLADGTAGGNGFKTEAGIGKLGAAVDLSEQTVLVDAKTGAEVVGEWKVFGDNGTDHGCVSYSGLTEGDALVRLTFTPSAADEGEHAPVTVIVNLKEIQESLTVSDSRTPCISSTDANDIVLVCASGTSTIDMAALKLATTTKTLKKGASAASVVDIGGNAITGHTVEILDDDDTEVEIGDDDKLVKPETLLVKISKSGVAGELVVHLPSSSVTVAST